jgi:hypothetical protein
MARSAFTSTASPGQLLHALGELTEVLAAGGIADDDEAEGLRRYAEHVERILVRPRVTRPTPVSRTSAFCFGSLSRA